MTRLVTQHLRCRRAGPAQKTVPTPIGDRRDHEHSRCLPDDPLQAGMVFHSELDPGSAVYLAARGVTPGDVVGVAGCEVVVAESGEQTGTLWVNLSSSSPVSRRWECRSRRRVPVRYRSVIRQTACLE